MLSRRHFLALSGVAGLSVTTAACSEPTTAAPVPLEPDELSVNRAIEAARALQKAALALAEARPEMATLLRRVAAGHEEHLVALGSPSPTASPTASGSPVPTASPAAPPTAAQLIKAEFGAARTALRDGLAAAPAFAVLLCRIAAARAVNADLVAAAASRPAMGVLEPAPEPVATPTASGSPSSSGPSSSPGSASSSGSAGSAGSSSGSPASSSGSAATSAAATTSAGTTTGTTTSNPATESGSPATGSSATPTPVDLEDLDEPAGPIKIALDRLLAGEHAAVFAYPLLVARVGSSRRTLAADLWQVHRTDRDDLTRRLISAGVRPTVAEPAYDVGAAPSTAAKAAALATKVENGLAALATDLLAASAGYSPDSTGLPTGSPAPGNLEDGVNGDLLLGADQLVLSARRAAAWSGRPDAFPGQVVRTPATPTASPSATASPSGTASPSATG